MLHKIRKAIIQLPKCKSYVCVCKWIQGRDRKRQGLVDSKIYDN